MILEVLKILVLALIKSVVNIFNNKKGRRFLIVLILFLSFLAIIYTIIPNSFIDILIGITITFFGAIFGIYLSLEILIPYLKTEEKRIDIHFFEKNENEEDDNYEDLINLRGLTKTSESFENIFPLNNQKMDVPISIEHEPDLSKNIEDANIDKLDIKIIDEYNDMPKKVEKFLDPVLENQKNLFYNEGLFNAIKMRLKSIDKNKLILNQTSYFDNFVIHLSPDYNIFRNDKTVRKYFFDELLDSNGNIKSIEKSNFPNVFAVSGLIFSSEGKTKLPIRNYSVVIQQRNISNTFGGSWDYEDNLNPDFKPMWDEIDEELDLTKDEMNEIYYLGTVRRLELMGKPDMYILGITDKSVSEWGKSGSEEISFIEIDLLEGINDVQRLKGIETVLENTDQIINNIIKKLDDYALGSIDYQFLSPSMGLLTSLFLLKRLSLKYENLENSKR